MANRVKEDEKNERIIRNLLKLPDNRRCINCNSLGPQYVCTNFWTFVCTTCSGIHREFTHRVKSVSIAKFTSQEVSALQGGGNASAKEIYFKEWDPQRQSAPDSSNVERLRDFIKHVYVDRRYTGERSFENPSRVKMGEAVDFGENRRTYTYQGGSRSPPYEDTYGRYSDRPSPGGRSDDRNYRYSNDEGKSPSYETENRQYGDYRRSPARPEVVNVVNDWRREDRFGNGRRSDDSRIYDGGSKLEGRSPDHQRDLDMSNPPMVRPVRDILGENVSPLRVIEPPKPNGGRAADSSARAQRTASSSSLASSNGNPAEVKMESSLIDFDAVPEPSTSAAVPQVQQNAPGLSVAQPTTSSNSDNWANFDSGPEVKVSQAPSNANSLEYVLSELTFPASVPGQVAVVPGSGGVSTTAPVSNMSLLASNSSLVAPMGRMSVFPFGSGAPAAAPMANLMFPPAGPTSVLPVSSINSFVKVADGGQWSSMNPQQHSLFPATGSQPPVQPFTPATGGVSSNQQWNSLLAPNTQGPSSVPAAQASQAVPKPAMGVISGVVTQPSPMEVKLSGRRELPEDLFNLNYSSTPAPVPGWHMGPPHGIGFTMQYNTALPMPTYPQSKSTNPFEVTNDPSPVQAPTFPSMASLQAALPNMAAPTGLLRTSSLGTPSPTWMSLQSSHPVAMPSQSQSHSSALPLHSQSHSSAMPQSSHMGQQLPINMAPRQQGVMGFGLEGAAFGSLNPNQQLGGLYSALATPNTFSSVGGNPFG